MMMAREKEIFRTFLILATLHLLLVSAIPPFMERIPNGYAVPDPCNSGQTWDAVGHLMALRGGGKNLNPFGAHFAYSSFRWTRQLCRMDSDNDGKTNGEELGDPNCQWTMGETPAMPAAISHPGICEPVTTEACIAQNLLFLNNRDCPALANVSIPNPWLIERHCSCYCLQLPTRSSSFPAPPVGLVAQPGNNKNLDFLPPWAIAPPLEETAEFNQENRFKVEKECICACPKAAH